MSSRSSSQRPEPRGERVQKVLARTGLASRREIDRLIKSGRIVIDGRSAVPGDRLIGHEKVLVDGRRIRLPSDPDVESGETLLYHKPVGEVTTTQDADGRPTVFERLPRAPYGRWVAVGRLDINTSGLLLFTTDGELAHRLMHPRFEVQREYAVRVRGRLSDGQLEELGRGVALEDGIARFEQIEPMRGSNANSWYRVLLAEGRNREVRRMFEAIGVTVSRLIRIRYGPIDLGRLPRGQFRLLDDAECAALRRAVGMTASSGAP